MFSSSALASTPTTSEAPRFEGALCAAAAWKEDERERGFPLQ